MLVSTMMRVLVLGIVLVATAAGAAEDLVKTLGMMENQFFVDWQKKRLESFRVNIGEDGLAWSGYGVFDKKTQIELQTAAEASCVVTGFELSDLRVSRPDKNTAIIIYNVRQEAACGGALVPSPLTNASVYIKRKGKWVNVFRASQPLAVAPK